MKKIYFLVFGIFLFQFAEAQSIQKMAEASLQKMQPRYAKLNTANVNLKYRKRGSAMAASYTWWSVFRKPANRKYKVIINENVKGNYMCFQFDHLTANARDGVMAHELAHVDFFHSLNFFGFIKFIINQALPKGLKKSERATDYRTIANGMGQELRTWSKETRDKFAESSDEPIPTKFSSRYFTPQEIDSVMKLFPTRYYD